MVLIASSDSTERQNHVSVSTPMGTFVCVYYNPEEEVANVIEDIAKEISQLDRKFPLILAGDMNCRIDLSARSSKGTELSDFLRSKGLALINDSKNFRTYFAPNGKSTVDLVFSNRSPSLCNSPFYPRRYANTNG